MQRIDAVVQVGLLTAVRARAVVADIPDCNSISTVIHRFGTDLFWVPERLFRHIPSNMFGT